MDWMIVVGLLLLLSLVALTGSAGVAAALELRFDSSALEAFSEDSLTSITVTK